MYDIIIIGAGPAGMTAGIYARRAMKKTLILEAANYGGQIVNTLDIENYPAAAHISGFDFATNLYNQAKELGVEFKFEKAIEIINDEEKTIKTENNSYKAKAIIIATGVNNKKLGLVNEDNLVGRGISYCATCDGNFYKDQEVAVVGGGNTALDDALYLSNIAKKVYLIHRREEFRGDILEVNRLKEKDNIEFVLNSNIIKLNGIDSLESIEVCDNNNNTKEIKVSCLFIAIGQVPENSLLSEIKINESGYIISEEDCHTNMDGIFVAGDIREKSLRQLVTATNDGAISATEAIKYLERK